MYYKASKSAWMNSKNFKVWFHDSFVKNIPKKQKFTTDRVTSGK